MSNEMSVRIEMTGGFLAMAALGLLCGGWEAMSALALAAAVHEWGHLAALLAQGCALRALRLDASGLCLRYDEGRGGYPACFVRALAGPGAGLALGGLLALAAGGPFLRFTARVSLGLSLVNLLPAPGLDGGWMLHSLLAPRLGLAAAAKVCLAGGVCSLLLTLALGLWLEPGLLVFSLWLLLGILRAGTIAFG